MLKKTLIALFLLSFVISAQSLPPQNDLHCRPPLSLTRPSACDPINDELLHQRLFRLEQSVSRTQRRPLVNESLSSPTLSIQAKEPRWRPLGPNGGFVIGMEVNPEDPNKMFCLAGFSYSGYSQLYVSSNAGQKWKRQTVLNRMCYDIEMDPKDPAVLYVLAYSSLLKSTDSGKTWEEIEFDTRFLAYGGKICIHPTNPKIIYLSGRWYPSGYGSSRIVVFKTKNAGKNWVVQEPDTSISNGYITCLAIDPLSPQILYAGGYARISGQYTFMLYKTIDGGQKWAYMEAGLPTIPQCIAIDPNNTHRVYVATTWGVSRSSDQGDTWQICRGSVAGYTVAVSPLIPDEIYAGYSSCMYKSTDGGANWTRLTGGVHGVSTQLFQQDHKLFYLSSAGIFMSLDGGLSWQTRHKGIRADSVPVISMAPGSPQVMYTEAAGNAMFSSTKYGNKWKRLPYFERCGAVINICVNPSDADDLFILADG